MHRTQIYLPEQDYQSLREVSRQRGLTMAELVRRAVVRFLREENPSGLADALQISKGSWSDRTQTSEEIVQALRSEWSERSLPR